jgi:hypothetical protein
MADSPLWLGVVGAVTGGVGALAGIGSLAWNVRSFTLPGFGISWRTPDSSRRDNAHLKFEGAPQMPHCDPSSR